MNNKIIVLYGDYVNGIYIEGKCVYKWKELTAEHAFEALGIEVEWIESPVDDWRELPETINMLDPTRGMHEEQVDELLRSIGF